MDTRGLPDIYTLSPRPRVYISGKPLLPMFQLYNNDATQIMVYTNQYKKHLIHPFINHRFTNGNEIIVEILSRYVRGA